MASGFRRVETFLFSSKLSARGRSFRFRSSFAFNEDPLNIQKHRDARFYTQVRVSFCRKKKKNKMEQKEGGRGGRGIGSSHQFLNYRLFYDSLSPPLPFFLFPRAIIPPTNKKEEGEKEERNIKS